ncbi:MAG: hypothetical protein JSV34_05110 [Candidatus Omnitrophota bacterium]|nr:MAG: hypothetical protein JSV34_05110 [Candidatus Omnitrophota bacterium]
MGKRNQLFPSYEYLDSQRLKDTFFSSPSKKIPKKYFIFILFTILSLIIIIFLSINYDVIIIRRRTITDKANSLIRNKDLASIHCLNTGNSLPDKNGSFIHLPLPIQEKTGIKINLKKLINLNTNHLILCLKTSTAPLKIGFVIKDIYCHSNSLNPMILDIKKAKRVSMQIPIKFKDTFVQNTKLSKINQINIYFYPQNKERPGWILIKDLVVANSSR